VLLYQEPNNELNQIEFCIFTVCSSPWRLAFAETYAGKSSFATGTSIIAAFCAVADDCVFFRNLSKGFHWQQKFIYFLEAKGRWIQYCGLIGSTISPSDKCHSRLYGCAVTLNDLLYDKRDDFSFTIVNFPFICM
jgi:hypothetical protein